MFPWLLQVCFLDMMLDFNTFKRSQLLLWLYRNSEIQTQGHRLQSTRSTILIIHLNQFNVICICKMNQNYDILNGFKMDLSGITNIG